MSSNIFYNDQEFLQNSLAIAVHAACLHVTDLESQAHCMTMAKVLQEEGGTGKFAADRVLEVECGNQTGDAVIKTH